jgi:predicted acylesterase/phospholipase RssA
VRDYREQPPDQPDSVRLLSELRCPAHDGDRDASGDSLRFSVSTAAIFAGMRHLDAQLSAFQRFQKKLVCCFFWNSNSISAHSILVRSIQMTRRAITLGGGGPAAGLHIGVLDALAKADITFDVWSLSCIGAWVGIVYNQSDPGKEVDQTYRFFRDRVFRDDEGYKRFPINTVFGPDWRNNIDAVNEFVTDPENYKDFQWQPYKMFDYFQDSLSILANQMPRRKKRFRKLDEGDFNGWILNDVMAPNPFVRYLTSMMYLSKFNGLSRINYPDSEFMKNIKFERLFEKDQLIFHNAWNLDNQELAFFANQKMECENEPHQKIKKSYKGPISPRSLCACSALPFIEETVEIDGTTYCEGALVDTVNFEGLVENEKNGEKLEEIWISRIVDSKQIRKPENLHDALANLCQLFAASVGEDDVKLFKYHVQYDNRNGLTKSDSAAANGSSNEASKTETPKGENSERGNAKGVWNGTVVEIHVPGHINFKWNHSNLDNGRKLGRAAAEQAIRKYKAERKTAHADRPLFINDKPEEDAHWLHLRDELMPRLQEEAR